MKYFIILIFVLPYSRLSAQDWIMKVDITGYVKCFDSNSTISNSIKAVFNGGEYKVQNVRRAPEIKLLSFTLTNGVGTFQGSMSVNGGGDCWPANGGPSPGGGDAGGFVSVNYSAAVDGESCKTITANLSNDTYYLYVNILIYRPLGIIEKIPQGDCHTVIRFIEHGLGNSFKWSVSQNASNYFVLPGKTSSVIDLRESDLTSFGFTTRNIYIKVEDASCSSRGVVFFAESFQFHIGPPQASIDKVNITCFGGMDAKITIRITPADSRIDRFYIKGYSGTHTAPDVQIADASGFNFELTKDNIFPGSGLDRIVPGNWTIKISNQKDINTYGACESVFSNVVNITEPPEFKITSAIPTNVSCNALDVGTYNDGSVKLTIQNGNYPFYFKMAEASSDNYSSINPDNRYTSNPSIGGLEKKNYKFIAQYVVGAVTCSSPAYSNVIIGEPTQRIIVTMDSWTNNKCKGGNIGSSINISSAGGNSGHTYRWFGPSSYTSTSQDISNIYAGNYSLAVTDAKGCANYSFRQEITDPSVGLIVSPTPSRYGSYNVTCLGNDGMIDLNYQNNNYPITSFEWKKNGSVITPVNNEHLKNLNPASYSVKVTDANGCSANAAINMQANPGISGNIVANNNYNGYSTKCDLSDEGTATVSVNNGFGALRYEWKYNNQVIADANSRTLFDLSKGIYHAKVTDANQCVYESDVVITSPLSIKPQLQIPVDGQISCPGFNDGKLKAVPINGYGSYHYKWDHNSSISTPLAQGLSKGIYKVTVTDDYGCSADENFPISDPPKMKLFFTKKSFNGFDLSCFGKSDGEVTLKIQNGQGAPGLYKYRWSNNATTSDIRSLAQGDYAVRVTDGKNCVADSTISIIAPRELSTGPGHINNFNGFDIKCFGGHDGAAKVEAKGGTGTYTYLWSNGITSSNNSGLGIGTYSVKVTDSNGCNKTDKITLTEPLNLSVSANVDKPVSCFGFSDGKVSIRGEGGVAPYTYSTDQSLWSSSNSFGELAFGNRNFYLKDANGCQRQVDLTIPQPDVLQLSFGNRIDAICNDHVGSVQALVTGGNGSYRYSWYDEISSQSLNTGNTLNNAIAGIYRVDVVDSKNCTISDNTYISSIGGAVFDLQEIIPVTCFGYSDGAASIAVREAISPYLVRWSDGQKTENASKLSAGKFFATVEDGIGCKAIRQVTIPTPEAIQSDFIKTQPLCFGEGNGSIQAIVSGGTSPYKYKWENLNNTTNQISNLIAGTYLLNIEDEHRCTSRIETRLLNPDSLQLEGVVVPPSCLGRCDGAISAFGRGGTGSYDFAWQDGTKGSEIGGRCPGDYTVMVNDSNGCQTNKMFTVPSGKPLAIDLGSIATLCVGQSKVLDPGPQWKNVNWTSNTGFTSTESKVSVKEPGNYFFKGIDERSCIALDTFKLATSLDLLNAEFLMPANAIVGDTLVAIDISWPLPEKVEWNYPTSFKPLTSSVNGILYAQLQQSGTFSLGMKSFLAECRDLREKTINVLDDDSENISGGRLGFEELIQEFTLSPNPNNGHFAAKVLLSEEVEMRLRVVQYPTGIILAESMQQQSKDHNVNFTLESIPQGLYTLLLNVKDQQRFLRFFKQ